MKISILYVSKSGNTKTMAEAILSGINKVGGVDARAFDIEGDVDVDFVNDSQGVILGTPTYLANTCWQIKKWLDEAREFKLAGKLGGAFATANYVHGGADIAILSILQHLLVKGMLVYSGGGAYGAPVIHLGPVTLKETMEKDTPTFVTYGERFASKVVEMYSK